MLYKKKDKTIFHSLAAFVRKILFCRLKIKFISLGHRVISPLYAKTTAAATPENSDMLGGMAKNNRAVRAPRVLEVHFFDAVCQRRR